MEALFQLLFAHDSAFLAAFLTRDCGCSGMRNRAQISMMAAATLPLMSTCAIFSSKPRRIKNKTVPQSEMFGLQLDLEIISMDSKGRES